MDSGTYDCKNKMHNKLKSATGCYNTILFRIHQMPDYEITRCHIQEDLIVTFTVVKASYLTRSFLIYICHFLQSGY
jgi:hypothetical protein